MKLRARMAVYLLLKRDDEILIEKKRHIFDALQQ
jgi:hypothetical protein